MKSEQQLNDEAQRITMKIAKVMKSCDRGMAGCVLGNMLGMYLWTFPPEKREDMMLAVVELAFKLVSEMPDMAPDDVRAPH